MSETLLPRVIQTLEKLVSFDTTSRNSNLELIHYIDNYLKELGAETEWFSSSDGKKANLLAVIGPKTKGGIVFSGHTDVVPVDGQEWHSDPFTLTQKDGKLFGRGTSDMKSFIAVALALAPEFIKLKLSKPLYFAFSYDEEVGCLGAPALAEALAQRGSSPDIAIIGEPTGMRVINRHKSVHTFFMHVTGHEAHSSAVDEGVSAILIASKIINYISELQEEVKVKSRNNPDSVYFDPPFTTMQVGVIQGGTVHNIIPKHCMFEWEIRSLPTDDVDALIAKVEGYAQKLVAAYTSNFPDVGIKNVPDAAVPGLKANADNSIENLLMSLAGTNKVETASFATEAGIFQAHAIPAIVCGPGSILQAHKPNEYIEISQLESCVRFMQKLVATVG